MASTMRSTLSFSRPSEKLGTHSTSVDISWKNSWRRSREARLGPGGLKPSTTKDTKLHEGLRSFFLRVTQCPLWLMVFSACVDGAAPLGVQPGQNSQPADFDWAGGRDLKAPEAGVVVGRDIHGPDRAGCGNQASEALLGANAEQMPFSFRLDRGLGRGRVARRCPRADIAFASRVPIDVIAAIVLRHVLTVP